MDSRSEAGRFVQCGRGLTRINHRHTNARGRATLPAMSKRIAVEETQSKSKRLTINTIEAAVNINTNINININTNINTNVNINLNINKMYISRIDSNITTITVVPTKTLRAEK
mmetsp:Transcript_9402/g.13106  ORF Transcript_9402/g.13106 Transcript_9402/m.13106 type:complete len:113 (-) Transcript_9402:1465-1803(-)